MEFVASSTPPGNLGNFLPYRFRLCEQIQIVRAAGLGVGARHIETAERMRADHSACAFAVDVQIADVKLAEGALDLVARLGIDRSREAEFGIVGNFKRV